jgi:hypothetical protein
MLADILIAGINNRDEICSYRCQWASDYGYAYLELLEKEQLLPTQLLCISEAIKTAEQLPDPQLPDPVLREPESLCENDYDHQAPQYRKARQKSLDKLNKKFGLCLHCFRSGSVSSFCQTSHSLT